MRWILPALVLWGCGPAARAAEPSPAANRVVAVEFEGPASDEVRQLVEVQPGRRFSLQEVRRSVKLLYHTGLFGQVQVWTRRRGSGLVCTFRLFPRQRVARVKLVGNEEVASIELRRLLRLRRGDEYDEWSMRASAQDMAELYAKRGWRRARIVAEARALGSQMVEIYYFIQEGPPTRISRIWFKGHPGFRSGRLLRVAGLSVGQRVDGDALKQARERLLDFYHDHGFYDARIEVAPPQLQLEAAWEVVTITIDSGLRYQFHLRGNRSFRSARLLKLLQAEARAGTYDSRRLLQRLRHFYRQHGYARVALEATELAGSRAGWRHILISISEGPRVRVRRIEFVGNASFNDEQLRAFVHNALLEAVKQPLANQPIDGGDLDFLGGGIPGSDRPEQRDEGYFLPLAPEQVFLPEAYRVALKQIADLYRANGYLRVEVGEPLLYYSAGGGELFVTVPITEGVQTRIESISFAGNHFLDAARLLEIVEGQDAGVSPGAALDLLALERLRRTLAEAYAEQGFIYNHIESELDFSQDGSLAEVTFEVREGPRVRVGRVLVRGQVQTKDVVFDNLIDLRRGEWYAPTQARRLRRDLERLGIFSGVDVKLLEPEVVAPVKNVLVEVREQLAQSLAVSPGISSAEGVRLQLDYTHRNLGGYALELLGRAKVSYLAFYPLYQQWEDRYQRMSFWEGLEGYLLAGLHWPRVWLSSADLSARLDLLGLQDHAISHDLTKFSLTPGLDWEVGRGLALSVESELEFDNLGCLGGECGGPTHKYLRYDEGSLLLATLRPKLRWDRRDDLFNPHRGLMLSVQSELAGNLLGARPVLYWKVDGTVTGYLPLARQVTLALSLRAGLVLNLRDDSRTPSHKLFWLGGRNSNRGFAEEGLIPADQVNPDDPSTPCVPAEDAGEQRCVSLGGNALLQFKTELRFPLVAGFLDGALFLDLGNLWIRPQNLRPYNLRPAAGLGLRLHTPVGPLAFDLAFNLDPDPRRREQIWFLHFNIGVF